MPLDPMKVARMHRNLRSQALRTQAHHNHISHTVMPNEAYDPSLSNQFVYRNRADWYAAAAIQGFCDVDLQTAQGMRRYLPMARIVQIVQPKRITGMSLYE